MDMEIFEGIPEMDTRRPDHYVLEDGRIWSVGQAKFVDSVPEGGLSNLCRSEPERTSLQVLVDCLELYGYPKGELKSEADLRAERNALLDATDYVMMPDYPASQEDKARMAAYRQALRDLPAQDGWPGGVVWPEKPEIS